MAHGWKDRRSHGPVGVARSGTGTAHAAPRRPIQAAKPHAHPKAPKLSAKQRRAIALAWSAVKAFQGTVTIHNRQVHRIQVALERAQLAAGPPPGGFVIDYAWTRPNAAAIRAAGYQGVMRYLSDTPSKDIDRGERAALQTQHLEIGLNWETTETRALQGAGAGAQDAAAANARADQLGAPTNAAIYFSCDTDVPNPAAVRPYYQAAHAASKRPVGVYAERAIVADEMNLGNAKYGWVTNSSSWGPQGVAAPRAALQQFYGTQHLPTIAGSVPTRDYDENLVMHRDWGQWAP
ncbi:MAG TPA: glycoside hydrolase domain-containing protein [Acidimicrobiia bacterium]